MALSGLRGKRRAGKHGDAGHEARVDDLRDGFAHTQVGCRFQPFCGAEEGRISREMRKGQRKDATRVGGWYSANDDLRFVKDFLKLRGCFHTGRNGHTGQVFLILTFLFERLREGRVAHPKADIVLPTAAGKHDSQTGAPATPAKNRDAAQAVSPLDFPKENLGSVPSPRRCRLASCLKLTSAHAQTLPKPTTSRAP